MSSLREIKERIASVNSTLKITSAMKMVASAKLHKAQLAMENMLPYEQKLHGILVDLMMSGTSEMPAAGDALNEYSEDRAAGAEAKYVEVRPVKKVAIVAWASNSSLCGAFNANAVRHTAETIKSLTGSGIKPSDITVYCVGNKMEDAMRKLGYESPADYSRLSEKPSYQEASSLAQTLTDGFISGRYDKVILIYNHYKSTSSQPTVEEVYLPFSPAVEKEEPGRGTVQGSDYIVEPDAESVIAELLPKSLKLKIYTVQLDVAAAEHAARTVAMQTATDNGNDILQELTLEYNKGRQQKITNEILDIVGGSMQ
jgi:F-type H+-transporting ATPase subunit gamma